MNAFRDLQARSRHQGVDLSEVLDDLLGELARRDETAPESIAKVVGDALRRGLNDIVDAQAARSARPPGGADEEAERRLGDAQVGEAYAREVMEAEADRLRKSLAEAEHKVEAQRAEISRLTDKVQDIQGRLAIYHGSYVATTSMAGKRYRILLVEDTDG